MSPIAPALELLRTQIADLTGRLGAPVDVAVMKVTDRSGDLPLRPPGLVSPNGACRLIRAAEGWIAVNLARDEDHELVPAWLRREISGDVWQAIERCASERSAADLVADAILLGLPVARVGETIAADLHLPQLQMAEGVRRTGALKVIDLSALWAGPLCGGILAEMGAQVFKIESKARPDPVQISTPDLDRRLNGRKERIGLDVSAPLDQAELRDRIAMADILITSARPRAFAGLGLPPETLFVANPGLVWVAVTGYGWTGAEAMRVAFGDDAAAAGGLLHWTQHGPRFLGDALADPLTGLAAAVGALQSIETGGGVVIDAAMARCAAGAAALCGFRDAA